ncbi:MAG: hypothetical protein ACR65R_12245 [Methylomicrobium sp.]
MFTQISEHYTIRRLVIPLLAAGCLLLSMPAYGQDGVKKAQLPIPSARPADTRLPPVEQTLVPEGVFAGQLIAALKLGPISDEAKAEALLSSLGIEPRNGWITDYPVTPAVLGDIEKKISVASERGRIALSKDQALKRFSEVKTRLGLDVMPAPETPAVLSHKPGKKTLYSYIDDKGETHYTDVYDSIPTVYRSSARTLSLPMAQGLSDSTLESPIEAAELEPTATPPPDDINDYFEEQGPPVVTYYSPPVPYDYLYTWTPYPFWSTGFYFPGFFVLNNFHRKIFFGHHHHFVTHHGSHGGKDRDRFSFGAGPGKGRHARSDGMMPSPWFSTPQAKTGAKAIVSLKQNRYRPIRTTTEPQINAFRKPFVAQKRNSRIRENNPVIIPWNNNSNLSTRSRMPRVTSWANSPKVITQNPASTMIPWDNNPKTLNRQETRRFRARPSLPSSGGIQPGIDVPRRSYSYSTPVYRQNRVIMPSQNFSGNFSGRSTLGGAGGGFQGGGSFRGFGGGSVGGSARGRAHR